MIKAFDEILAELRLDPAASHEGQDWWRFQYEGVSVQGGVHSSDFRLLCSLCELRSNVDLDAVYDSLAASNTKLPAGSVARFIESDNYLYAQGKLPFAVVTKDALKTLLLDCVALSKSDLASSLRLKY